MGKLTEIEKYAQAPWVYCPSLHFEKLGRLKDSDLLSSINQQIKECLYSHSSGGKISKIWMHFERLVNSILSDLHTIVNDDTCTIVRIGTLNALQPKWLVLRKMYESVKKYDIQIIAYCIMNNHTHMLIEVRHIEELIQYMKRLKMATMDEE